MPNRINSAMNSEYTARFGEAPDLVAIDYNGLTVEEMVEFRSTADSKGIHIFVVKNSIARRVLSESVEKNGLDQVIIGQTALLYGGEGMPDVARLIGDFNKKTGKATVRGGVFDKKVIPPEEVAKFKDIPDRQTLLAQTLATITAPLTNSLGVVNALLRAPAALTDALVKKKEEEGS